MTRTTESAVTTTIDTNLDSEAVIDWIEIASEIVDDIANIDSSISDTRLRLIEKLVAQHMLSAQDPRVEEDEIGDSSAVYQGNTRRHFEATQYGQRAIALDPTNTLTSTSKEQANIRALDSRNMY